MSSTRKSQKGASLRQNRWCSSPVFNDSINGAAAAKRIARVPDQRFQEMLWWIQWRSLDPNGLAKISTELFDEFPERVGTPSMRVIIKAPEQILKPDEVERIEDEIRSEGLGSWTASLGTSKCHISSWEAVDPKSRRPPASEFLERCYLASDNLPEFLARLCLDPEIKLAPDSEGGGVWYFSELIESLCELREIHALRIRDQDAETAVHSSIEEGLEFCLARRRWILIEGIAGIGKSRAAKTWCHAHAGVARYVEAPSSGDDRSFYAAFAEALGVARGTSYNGIQIKLRVQETLKESGLMLVIDEAQFCWGQFSRPRGLPTRVQWLMTLFNEGAPMALVGLPEFSKWQKLYVQKTLWNGAQFERRVNRKIALPGRQSKEDFMRIAQAHFPDGDDCCWELLAGYALASPQKQASAISEAMESAAYEAEKHGRTSPNFEDIDAVIQGIHLPCEHGYNPPATASPEAPTEQRVRGLAGVVQRVCKRPARDLQASPSNRLTQSSSVNLSGLSEPRSSVFQRLHE